MLIKVKKYHPDARMPEKAYDKDFCYDVYAVSEEEIAPNVWRYGIGLGFQIKREAEPILRRDGQEFRVKIEDSPLVFSIDLRPRSSVWKTGMVLSNCEGTIDEGYTNETAAIFYHVIPSMPRYRVGDRIGQIKVGTTFPINFVEVEEFEDTERGMRGYGSTGNN
jgi:dUTP pyrophosphatase